LREIEKLISEAEQEKDEIKSSDLMQEFKILSDELRTLN